MNKLFTKIGVAMVGLAMAVGVGVAVGSDNSVRASATPTSFSGSDFTAVESSDYSTTKDLITVSVTASTVTSTQMRIFKGQTLTISTSSGTITNISLTCTASGTKKYGPGCFGDGAPSGYSYDGSTGTWSGNVASVVFTAEDNQVRATAIEVTRAAPAGSKTVTVTISGSLTKTSYSTSDSWSYAGLTASGVYDTDTAYAGDFSWTYSPATPSAMGVGKNQDLTITASATTTGYTGFTTKVVKVDVTAVNDFESVIQDGHSYRIYSPYNSKDYYLQQNGSSSNQIATTTQMLGTVFTFSLVDDNTWEIKNGTDYLYCTSSAMPRFGNTSDRWVLAESTATTYDGTYSLYSVRASKYLSLYKSTPDYRAYADIGTNRSANIEFEEYTSDMFALDVVNSTKGICDLGSDNEKADFESAWTFLEDKYSSLIASEKTVFVGATYTRSGETVTKTGDTTQTCAEGAARYDYLVAKYTLKNFATGRDVPALAGYFRLTSNNSTNHNATLVIVIIASVSLMTIAGYFVIRRRKEK